MLFSKAWFSMHECYCTKIPLSGVLLLQWFSWHCRHCMTLIKRPYYHVCSINQYACKTQAPLFSSHPCIYVRLWYCKRLLKFSWSLTVPGLNIFTTLSYKLQSYWIYTLTLPHVLTSRSTHHVTAWSNTIELIITQCHN